jgi:hypothetical protein
VLSLLIMLCACPQVLAQHPTAQEAVRADINNNSVLWGVQQGGSAPTLVWQNQGQLDLGVQMRGPISSRPQDLLITPDQGTPGPSKRPGLSSCGWFLLRHGQPCLSASPLAPGNPGGPAGAGAGRQCG